MASATLARCSIEPSTGRGLALRWRRSAALRNGAKRRIAQGKL